ncbi:TIGR02996 domain-containing protein [Fimbriiglobus ruber]|uniref:TIGR02996 domain-containing protein n=1 Tax=Fimbriiglobus ruber TaxID=1908690 RepID=A0A225EA26_9BACT|nr:TIGR02996 domain-containing protein [Fimbriiglobus ruber]OWK45415.1 hypothetical protein FRUB_01746 [Fimbriiglobus ruber]
MSDEAAFLRAILASPGDATTRLVYADWLEEHDDTRRAEFLRIDTEVERLKGEGKSDPASEGRLGELSAAVDPAWLALVTILGHPFLEPFTGERFCYSEPPALPFADRIGTRGGVAVFETQFTDPRAWAQGLPEDLRFLSTLELGECAYGAASVPVYPFICELGVDRWPLTAADVLAALKAHQFRSAHIRTLDATTIPYPGYHMGSDNDEIHNDFSDQYIFEHEEVDEFEGTHGVLKRYVGGPLWYVLLHPTRDDGFAAAYVILLAVGRSPHGSRLVGVITQQMCHSLCE